MSNIDRVNISNPSLDPSYAVQGKDQVRVGQNGQISSAKSDSVALSSTARELDRYSGLVGQSRENRIDQVREVVHAGGRHEIGADKDLIHPQIEAIVISRRGIERSIPLIVGVQRCRRRSYQSRRCSKSRGVSRSLQFRLDQIEPAEIDGCG